MKNFFNYLKLIFKNVTVSIGQFQRGQILTGVQKYRSLLILVLGIFFLFPFILKLVEFLVYTNWPLLITQIYLGPGVWQKIIFSIAIYLVFQLFVEFLTFKRLETVQKTDDKQVSGAISLKQRIFVLLPFMWFLIELVVTMLDEFVQFCEFYIPENYLAELLERYVFPLVDMYSNLPGLELGIPTYFLFYFRYYFVGRNKQKFSYYTRYYYMQSLLVSMLFSFIVHLYFLLVKYEIPEEAQLLFSSMIISCFLVITFYPMLRIIFGQECKIPFFDEAIQYQVGLPETSKKKQKG